MAVFEALPIQVLCPAGRFGQEMKRIMAVAYRRRQQFHSGPVHHRLPAFEVEAGRHARPSLANRVHWKWRIPCVLGLR